MSMKMYLINLDRSPDRLADTKRIFDDAGLSFIRVAAVDGKALSPAERHKACSWTRFYLANYQRPTPGEIGCALSHRNLYETIVADGDELTAVFEDDVSLDDVPRFREAIASIEREDDPSVPTVWLLQSRRPKPPPGVGERMWFNVLEARDLRDTFWTSSYVLNLAAAKHLITLLTPIVNTADAWSTFARCGIRILAMAKPCCGQRRIVSTIVHKPGFLWRFSWFRSYYLFRWHAAFRLDLFLKRLSGKRFPKKLD